MQRTCPECGTDISHMRKQAIYCGPRCRKRGSRRHAVENTPPPVRIIPTRVPSPLRKPSVNDIASMFVEANGLAASFRLASEKSDWKLRPMCARMAAALQDAVDKEGVL